MPAGAEVLIAGPYTVTWNSVALGCMEGDAGVPTIEQTSHVEPVASTSVYGKTIIDGVYQGADCYASYTCMQYIAGVIATLWPYGTFGQLGTIGVLQFSLAQPLVFTAVTGTSAFVAGSMTLTASKAILAPGFNSKLLYGPTVRKVPIRQILLPFSTGVSLPIAWFTTT